MTGQDYNIHESYMAKAVELAKLGCGRVNPNPLVGAVLVKGENIISSGYHREYGNLHAEREALKNLDNKDDAKGADLYVTLEPCCHHGKQPPCTEAIIEAGIKRVFIGSEDPNPLVAGKGIEILRNNGIEVYTGILKDECDKINDVFFHFIKENTPYVVMKYAMTIDGKIATVSGKSRWITGEKAREDVHKDRKKYSAIMVGINTVIKDDPLLNCRIEDGVNPVRIICDTNLNIPLDSKLVNTASEIPLWIACVKPELQNEKWNEKENILLKKGCKLLYTSADEEGHVDLKNLMKILGKEKIDSVLLEGGALLNEAALKALIVRKIKTYIAPKIFGGSGAPSPVGGVGVDSPDEAYKLCNTFIKKLGEDILIESEVVY